MGYDLVHRLEPTHRLGPNLQRQPDRPLRRVVHRVGRGVADLLPRPLDVLQQLIDLTLSSLLWVRRQHSRMINSPSDLVRQPRQVPPSEQVFSVSACINQHFGFASPEHRCAHTIRRSVANATDPVVHRRRRGRDAPASSFSTPVPPRSYNSRLPWPVSLILRRT